MTPTLKQLAIALNTDVESARAKLIDASQQNNDFKLSQEIATWKADTVLPQWVIELAEAQGLDITRKRTPKKGMSGNAKLANPEQVVSAFMQQLPVMIGKVLQQEQDAFINEAKFSGNLTGLAGGLAYQQSLINSFAETNNLFRNQRMKGIEGMKGTVAKQYAEIFAEFCDTTRALESTNEQVLEASKEFDNALDIIKKAMEVSETELETDEGK